MNISITEKRAYSFEGLKIIFSGHPQDFQQLAKYIIPLTEKFILETLILNNNSLFNIFGDYKIIFSNPPNGEEMAVVSDGSICFYLDSRYWERILKFFVLLSWDKCTYYLNVDDSSLGDLDIVQGICFICSSEGKLKW